MANNTIIVSILGNTSQLQKSLKKAQGALTALQGNVGGLSSGLKVLAGTGAVAGAAMGGVMATGALTAAAALGSVTAAAGGLAAIPALFAKIGYSALEGTEAGKEAIDGLKQSITDTFAEASKPFGDSIIRTFGIIRTLIADIAPSLGNIYTQLAGVLDGVNSRLGSLAGQIGPALVEAFEAGLPAFQAVIDGLFTIAGGVMDMIRVLAPAKEGFGNFITVVMDGIAAMLPQFARLAVGLLPMATTIAEKVAPAFQSIVGFILNELLPLAAKLGPAFQGAWGFIGDIFFGIGQSLPALTTGINGFWEALGQAGGAGGDTEALFRTLGETIGGLLPLFGELLAAVIPVATQFLEVFGPAIAQFGGIVLTTLIPAISSMLDWLSQNEGVVTALVAAFFAFSAAGTVLGPILKLITAGQVLFNTAMTLAGPLLKGLPILLRLVGAGFTAMLGPVGLVIAIITAVIAVVVLLWNNCDWFRNAVIATWNAIKSGTETAWNAIKSFLSNTWENIKSIASSVWNAVKNFFSNTWDSIKSKAQSIWDGIKSTISNAINNAKSTIESVLNTIKAVWSGTWDTIKTKVSTVWEGIKDGVRNAINSVREIVGGLKDKVMSVFSNAASWLVSAGKDVVQGLWNGIKNMGSWLKNKVSGFVEGMVDSVLGVLGINSPSRVFRDIGMDVNKGLAIGLARTSGVAKAATGLAKTVADNFSAPQLEMDARLNSLKTGGHSKAGQSLKVEINFNGLVTDPVAAGKEVDKVLQKYAKAKGQVNYA